MNAAEEPPGGWAQAPPPSPHDNPYAIKYPLGRVWLLTVVSFGLYGFYWFYKNRRLLDGEYGDRDDAILHTCGLLVPVFSWFCIYWLWRDLNDLRLRLGLTEFAVVPYLVGSILGLSPIFFSFVVNELGEYWDARTGGLALDAPITTEEKVIGAVGAGLMALFVVFIVLVIVIAAIAGSSN